jgi:hypothetical protein
MLRVNDPVALKSLYSKVFCSRRRHDSAVIRLYSSLLPLVVSCIIAGAVNSDWQSTLESHFDVVETFDNYQDWIPGKTSSLPQYIEGGTSRNITSVAYWDSVIPVEDRAKVITRYPGKSVRNSKAIRFNWMGDGVGNSEASTMHYYFGNGTEVSGYNDFYIFGMIYVPSDKFPTEVNNERDPGSNRYGFNVRDGEQALYMISAKMIEVSMGFVGGYDWSDDHIRTSSCRWGWSEVHFMLIMQKGPSDDWRKVTQLSHTDSGGFIAERGVVNVDNWLDRPFYYEIHLHKESAIGQADGSVVVTFYNADGTGETEVLRAENIMLLDPNPSCKRTSGIANERANRMKFNWINFESNWRVKNPDTGQDSYLRCGSHKTAAGVVDRPLHCSSYYDDLIINDTRIAPTYFRLLAKR